MRVGTRVGIMTAASVAMFVIIGSTTYISMSKLIESYKWVLHTQDVLEELQTLLFELSDAAANERSYLIANQVTYLDDYKNDARVASQQLAKVKDLIRDNPNQRQRVAELEELVKQLLDAFETTLDRYADTGREAAFERVKLGYGHSLMVRIRDKISAMHGEETALLSKRGTDLERSARDSQMTLLAGVLLSVAFITLFNLFYAKDVVVRTRSLLRAADNIERGRLDELPISDSDDEFAELAGAFNHVVGLLRRKVDELSSEVNTFGSVNSSLRQLLSSLSRVSTDTHMAAQETMQAAAQARLLHSYASASCDEAAVAIQVASDRAQAATKTSSDLCERVAALERMALGAESIAAELSVVGLAASMETARMGENGAAFQSIVERLNKLSSACQEQSITAKQLLSLAQGLTTNTKDNSENSRSSISQAQELLSHTEKQLAQSTEALTEMNEAVSRLTEISSRHREELGEARSKAESVVAELLVKEHVGLEEAQLQKPESTEPSLIGT
jgi:CHASE3 domain sensor protein/ABC-type transporter Mla subunit MlaD